MPNVRIIGRVWGEMRECRLPRAWDHLSPGGSCHEDGTTFLPGEARFVVGFGAVVITAVIVFGQNTTFLDAYDSAAGQLVVGRRRPAAAYPAPAPAAEVTIVGLAYQLATVEVPAGATVHFTNTRTSVRTVTAGTPTAVGEAFAEVLNGEGSTVDVVIEQPGEQRYFCQVHPLHARGDRRGVSAAVLAQRSG